MNPQDEDKTDELKDSTEPSVNDVLSQQMGTEYTEVENLDKAALQKELKNQPDQPSGPQYEIPKPNGDETDDRNTSDGQLIGS